MDLRPTRTDFNLGTPRFEISSHSFTTDHRLCDSYNTYTIVLFQNNKVPRIVSLFNGTLSIT